MVALVALPAPARADRVDSQTRDLLGSGPYKVRLSAALQLSRSTDDRAIFALAEALRTDHQRSVRQVAAAALGRNVTPSTSPPARTTAERALQVAMRRDRDGRVRRTARASLNMLERVPRRGARGARRARSGSVFLHIGMPNDSTRRLSTRDRGALLKAVSRTIHKRAPTYDMATRYAELPTRAELEAHRMHGFFVGAQVADVSVERRGNRAEVRCRVAVRVGPWMGRDGGERMVAGQSASASGSARVMGSASPRGIRNSQLDCVVAVAEEITARQVVPFIQRSAR